MIYINDLSTITGESVVLYADDTSAIISGKDRSELEIRAEVLVREIEAWMGGNGLRLNAAKTQLMLSAPSGSTDFKLKMGASDVVSSGGITFLGIQIDCDLKWRNHTNKLIGRLSSVCFLLRSLSKYCDREVLLTVYHGCFHSLLTYCIEIWGNSAGLIEVLRIQKRAVRIIVRGGWRDHCRKWFKELGIMTSVSAYVYRSLLFIEQNISLYRQNSESHNYFTRHPLQLRPVRHRTTRFEKGLFYSALSLYNKMPEQVKALLGTPCFKKWVRRFFLDNPFYTLSEFYDCEF